MTDELRHDLDRLRDQIDRVRAGATDEQHLSELLDRVERHLDEDDEHEEPNLVERLEDAITRYEVEHPELTNVVSRIINTLSASGL